MRAKQDIQENEDVTISYLDGGQLSFKTRDDYFQMMWGFSCICSFCKEEKDKAKDERDEMIVDASQEN